MNAPTPVLSDFRSLLPRTEKSQETSLEWLSAAHGHTMPASDRVRLRKAFSRFGCPTESVSRRYSALDDFSHLNFAAMRIFALDQDPAGAGCSARTDFFGKVVEEVFDRLYLEETRPPSALLHVTCTGYDAPSGAERLIARRQWGRTTEVHHVYHMGCYASIPAIQLARGLRAASPSFGRVDLVHTELCSLHLNPTQHTPEQMVIQSLFADGLIRYSLMGLDDWQARNELPAALEILALRKEIISGTETAMTWRTGDHGMEMSLSREVPELISAHLGRFLERLLSEAPESALHREGPIFAIHPGGPKIIDQIRSLLDLSEDQVRFSRKVLFERGNMSSATLPHIWMEILEDPSVSHGTPIVSLAFGPGLTVCGAILEKRSR